MSALSFVSGVLACLALSGCGTLNVTMEVLDPQVIQREQEKLLVTYGIPKALAATDASIGSAVQQMRQAHREFYQELRDTDYARAATLAPKPAHDLRAIADTRLGNFDQRVGSMYQSLAASLQQYRAALVRALNGRYTVAPQDPNYYEVLQILRTWQDTVFDVQQRITKDTRSTVKAAGGADAPLLAAVEAEIAAITSALAQVSLQDSPYAYAVASAKPGQWSDGYNKVYTYGSFGATDVAIKLDPDTGNYLLKGLSFDPSDVAAVASKVSAQALLLATQIAGVPVKLSTPPADDAAGAALAKSSGALADAQARVATRAAQDEARKVALLAIANVIVNEESDLKSTDDKKRRAAIEAIRNAFLTREAILRPAASQ